MEKPIFSVQRRLLHLTLLCGYLIAVPFLFSTKSIAQGDVMIFPKRIVFENSKKSEEIYLVNNGKDTARYAVSFVQIRMKKNGEVDYITTPDAGQRFADKNIRFFPRMVTLGPKESQIVKIQTTRTNELTNGEYRSHLYFRAIPPENPLGEEPPPSKDSGIAMSLRPIYGLTIPVIIRVGQNTSQVSLSDLSFETVQDSIPVLNLLAKRTGDMSIYGNIIVNYISSQGKAVSVAAINGVAVYTPNPDRQFRIALDRSKGINYHTGKLHVAYTTKDETDKLVTLAETEIVLH